MSEFPRRIVAIEARRSRFGYALFEGPNKLLDWGGNSIRTRLTTRSATNAARDRISDLLRRSHPTVVIVMRPRRTRTGKTATPGTIMKAIVQQAAVLGLSIEFVTRAQIWGAFAIRNRDDIAEQIVMVFPELVARLPLRRKKWQPERRGMVIFDAVAVGMVYWARTAAKYPQIGQQARSAFPPAPHQLA